MLKNYLKIAVRNIRRHFSYSLINITGLAIGFASAMLIGIWVYQEWSYDRHFEDADRIYRVGVNFMNVGDMAVGPVQFPEYARDFPEVEQTARLSGPARVTLYFGDREFSESGVYYADSTFFELFSYPFLEGNPANALDQPNSIVLTQSVTQKYFNGGGSVLGNTLLMGEDKEPYVITGVVADPVYKSHINARVWIRREYGTNSNWLSASVYNYVKLKEGFATGALEKRLMELIETSVFPSLQPSESFDEWITKEGSYRFISLPITDIYLKSNLKFEPTATGSESNVYIFSAIAILVLLIASINFVNITTARSSIRAKEVGIRKTLGTGRSALVRQFLFESVMLSAGALVLSFGLAELFLSFFERFTGLQLVENLFANGGVIISVIVIALTVGAIAGLYPAIYLTSFKPVRVLKGDIYSPASEKGLMRNALVLVQFTISVCLIVGTAVIYKQLQYMRTTDLGFDKDNVLVIENVNQLEGHRESFKQRLLQQTGVVAASYNMRIPAGRSTWVTSFRTPAMEQGYPMQSFHGDYDMISTLGFRILEGRDFSRDVASDTAAVILNQRAVQALELDDPLGTRLNDNLEVIGVVADFNFQSLKEKIEPAALTLRQDGGRLAVKFHSDARAVIDRAEQIWREMQIAAPMSYYFLDQNFEALLEKDELLARALLIFAILAILVSCMGLYGLSAYIAERKTKEIGIRRVLGATVANIVLMLNFSFTKTVIVAILVSIPVSFIIMNRWLQNFAYKTEIDPSVFIMAGIAALVIAWGTVTWQSVRASLQNPVKSLRNE